MLSNNYGQNDSIITNTLPPALPVVIPKSKTVSKEWPKTLLLVSKVSLLTREYENWLNKCWMHMAQQKKKFKMSSRIRNTLQAKRYELYYTFSMAIEPRDTIRLKTTPNFPQKIA